MEKYTIYADPRTGVNPFLPRWADQQKQGHLKAVGKGLLVTPLVLIRLIVALVAVLYLLAIGLITSILGCVSRRGSRVVAVPLRAPGFWLLFPALGINLDIQRADQRRLGIRPSRDSLKAEVPSAKPGDLVFCNFTGFSEVLLFYYFYSAVFVSVHDNSCSLVGPWTALRLAFGHRGLQCPGKRSFDSLSDVCQYCQENCVGPAVVFPEQFKSNGAMILRWLSKGFSPSGENPRIRRTFFETIKHRTMLFYVSYDKTTRCSPPHTVGNWFIHILWMMSQIHHRVTIHWAGNEEVVEFLEKAFGAEVPSASDLLESLRSAQCRMSPGALLAEISGEKGPQFAEYFSLGQTGRYMKQR